MYISAKNNGLLTQSDRKKYLRPFWERYCRNIQSGIDKFLTEIGTVYYLDPTAATNGTGTFLSPFNTFPAYTLWAGNTILIREGTILTTALSISTSASRMLGSYSTMDGKRVVDKNRIATINITSSSIAVSLGSTTTGNKLYLSGLRICGGYSASGVVYGAYLGNGGSGSETVIEHCVFDSSTGVGVNTLLSIRSEKTTLRFNTFTDYNSDLVWLKSTTVGYLECYCNEFNVSKATTLEGPDCLQLTRDASTNLWVSCLIYGNWFDHQTSGKQAFIIANNPPSTGESLSIYNNFFFGVDPTVEIDFSGDGYGAKAILTDGYGISVRSNYIDNFRLWLNTRGSQTLPSVTAYNIFVSSEKSWSVPGTTSKITVAGDYNYVAHNTFITINTQSVPTGAGVIRVEGINSSFVNNLFSGPWSKALLSIGTGQVISGNAYTADISKPQVDISAVNVGTFISTGTYICNGVGELFSNSGLIGTATSLILPNGVPLVGVDPFGNVASKRYQNVGAYQGCGIS